MGTKENYESATQLLMGFYRTKQKMGLGQMGKGLQPKKQGALSLRDPQHSNILMGAKICRNGSLVHRSHGRNYGQQSMPTTDRNKN